MKYVNDFYNERGTEVGIARIYRLFDNDNNGYITKTDIERIASEFDMFFKPDQLDILFDKVSKDGTNITL